MQTVQPNFFIPAMHIGNIDFYHFRPVSLTLPGGHKVSPKQNLLASFFFHTFQLMRMNFDVVMEQFKLNILRLLLSKLYRKNGNNCCFTDCAKKLGMYSDVYESIWFKLGMIDTIVLYSSILVWPWPWFKVTGVQESQISAPVISQRFHWFGWNLVFCWCDEPHTHFISSIQYLRVKALLMWFCLK